MNIRVDLNYPIKDGAEVVFRSPVDCSQITGLKVYYPGAEDTTSQEFVLADAHGNNVGDIDHLFAEDVVVKVILDVTKGMAFVQNADTNAYIERTFIKSVNGTKPDENGNVEVAGGGGGTGKSGVYVGSGDMPADCNVQIDPNGECFTVEGYEEIQASVSEIGSKEIFTPPDPNDFRAFSYFAGKYIPSNYHLGGDLVEQDGCNGYMFTDYNQTGFLAGKTFKIRTYMYGDMAVVCSDNNSRLLATNDEADITANPESGIVEVEYTVPNAEEYWEVDISFCENPCIDAPVCFEKKGTVWEEIKIAQDKTDTLSAEINTLSNGVQTLSDEVQALSEGMSPADYVVAEGTSGGWKYRKWNSGLAECWGNIACSTTKLAGSLLNGFYSDCPSFEIPFDFVNHYDDSIVYINYEPSSIISTYLRMVISNVVADDVMIPSSNMGYVQENGKYSYNAKLYVVGKWK